MEKIKRRVLKASAGTGKTYRLSLEYILRIIYEIRRDAKVLDCYKSILAITFTKKATGEILERVFAQLEELVTCDINDNGLVNSINVILQKNQMKEFTKQDQENLKLVYQNMCSNKHKVFINTIDGFLGLIFKNCVRSQNNLTNINIVNSHKDDIYYAVCQKLFDDENLFNVFKEIYYCEENYLLEAKTTKTYLDIIKSLIGQYFKFVFFKNSSQDIAVEQIENAADDDFLFNNIVKEVKKVIDYVDSNKILREKIKKGIKIYKDEEFKQKYTDKDYLLKKYDFFEKPMAFVDGHQFGNKEVKEQKKQFMIDISLALLQYEFYRKDGAVNNHKKLCKFANDIFDIYNDIIFSIKEFDFNDIAIQVYKSFYENDDFCKTIDSNRIVTENFFNKMPSEFKHCLIDEAQDTSVLQWKVLEPLLRKVEDFTIVGDEKQAIYGWRGGETSLLSAVNSIFLDAELENLDTCFRSSKKVIDYVNEIFIKYASEEGINDSLSSIKWYYKEVKSRENAPEGSFHIYYDMYSKDNNQNESDQSQICHETKNESIKYFIENVVLQTINEKNIKLKDVAILARKNDLLAIFASILKENKVAYYLDSSKPFFSNVAVNSIMNLLKFIVWDDYFSLFEFFKSPIINVKNEIYKELLLEYRNKKSLINFIEDSDYPYIKLIEEAKKDKDKYNGVYSFIKRLFEDFSVTKAFPANVDCKNLYKLLELALNFDNEMVDYNKSLSGFLLYCEEHGNDESLASSTGVDAITLLTSHKSKGLEFPYVFVFNDVKNKTGNNSSLNLAVLSSYDDKYTKFKNFIALKSKTKSNINKCRKKFDEIGIRIEKIIKDSLIQSCFNSIIQKQNQEFIEQLNTLYVTITRPKLHLFFYNAVNKTKDFFDNKNKTNPSGLAIELINKYFPEAEKNSSKFFYEKHDGRIECQNENQDEDNNQTKIATKFDDLSSVCSYFDFDIQKHNNTEQKVNIDIEYLAKSYQERKRLTGIVVHDYLSKIKYASKEELLVAKQYIYTKYGNIFSKEQFDNIFEKTDGFISLHSDTFSKKWTRILNEYTLFDKENNKIYRIDRLLINDNTKEVKIVDYKTGKHDDEQIENYKSIIKKLGFSDWDISGDFLSFEV